VSNGTSPGASEVPSPDQREVPDPGRRGYDTMQVFQSLIEIQKDIASNSAKTDRLIADVDELDKKVDILSHALAWAKGFGIAAIILIPICAGFIWWLIGDKLDRIRDDLILGMKQPGISQPAPQPHK
jgi:hypothetical protein